MEIRSLRCIFCGDGGVVSWGHLKDSKSVQTQALKVWAKKCIETVFSVCELKGDATVVGFVVGGNCCKECIQIARDLDFIVGLVSKLERKKDRLRNVIRRKLGSNYKRRRRLGGGGEEMKTGGDKDYEEILELLWGGVGGRNEGEAEIPQGGDGLIYEGDVKVESREVDDNFLEDDLVFFRDGEEVTGTNLDVEVGGRVLRVPQEAERIPEVRNLPRYLCVEDVSCSESFRTKQEQELQCHDRRQMHRKVREPFVQINSEDEETEEDGLGRDYQNDGDEEQLQVKRKRRVGKECGICGQMCKGLKNLTTHIKDFHGDGPVYPCQICKMLFSSLDELNNHTNAHNDAHPFTCLICNSEVVVFTNTIDLRRHIQQAHYPSDLRCSLCPQVFTSKIRLELHLRNHNQKEISCKVCDHKVRNPSCLKKHMMKHSDERKYVCSECGETYKYAKNLRRHMMSHTGERPHQCRICGRAFKVADKLKKHEKTHLPSIKQNFSFVSQQSFATMTEIQEHQLSNHISDQDILDEPVSKISQNEEKPKEKAMKLPKMPKAVKKRIRIRNKIKPLLCQECGMSFKEESEIEYHRSLHNGRNPFDCVLCDEKLASTDDLKRHVRKTHIKYDFVCDICGTSFWCKDYLRGHQRIHNNYNGKKEKCPHCPYSTPNLLVLADHISAHKGEKRHTCEECGKSFQWFASLRYHRLVHSGKKLYSCNVCGNSYMSRPYLQKHQRSHSGAEGFTCRICNKLFNSQRSVSSHIKQVHGKEELKTYKPKT